MQGIWNLSKIKRTTRNVHIEPSDIGIVFPRVANYVELIVVKLKRDPKYRSCIYFETVYPCFLRHKQLIIQNHIKSFTETFLFQKVVQAKKC